MKPKDIIQEALRSDDPNYRLYTEDRAPVARALNVKLGNCQITYINRCPRSLPQGIQSISEEIYETREPDLDYVVRRVKRPDGLFITHILRRRVIVEN